MAFCRYKWQHHDPEFSDTAHGAVEGDFVTFSGAASLGGLITDTILNAEHQIVSIINANSYTITSNVALTLATQAMVALAL